MDDLGGRQGTRRAAFEGASDAELTRGMASDAAEEQDAAVTEFVRTRGERIGRFVRNRVRGRDEEEWKDVLQETLVRVYNAVRRGRYDHRRGSLVAFGCTVARNQINDGIRRLRAQGGPFQFVSAEKLVNELLAPVGSSPGTGFTAEAEEALEAALEKLPDHYQAVLELSRSGLSEDEIGRRIGKPAERVRHVRYNALKALARNLKREHDDRRRS